MDIYLSIRFNQEKISISYRYLQDESSLREKKEHHFWSLIVDMKLKHKYVCMYVCVYVHMYVCNCESLMYISIVV